MKIGFDVDSLTIKSGGIGRYAVNLINQILKIFPQDPQNEVFIFSHCSFDYDLIAKYPHLKFVDKYTHVKSNVLRKGALLPVSIRSLKLDVFHGLDHIGIPFLYKHKACRYVVTIHDLITRVYPDKFTLRHRLIQNRLLPLVLNKADKIIANSLSTRNDIIKFYPRHAGKIEVIYEGVEPKFAPGRPADIKPVLGKYGIDFKYLLFLGTIEPRKNITGVIEAFTRLKQRGYAELKLVITGRKGWHYKGILKKLDNSAFVQDIVFTDFIDDDDLAAVYSGAEILLYPSLYEGFGLPVIEAMACGLPVITSNVSSLPEVAGDAAVLINPAEVEEMVSAIEKLMKNPGLKAELREKGLEQAGRFSWEQAAEKTLKLFENIIT